MGLRFERRVGDGQQEIDEFKYGFLVSNLLGARNFHYSVTRRIHGRALNFAKRLKYLNSKDLSSLRKKGLNLHHLPVTFV